MLYRELYWGVTWGRILTGGRGPLGTASACTVTVTEHASYSINNSFTWQYRKAPFTQSAFRRVDARRRDVTRVTRRYKFCSSFVIRGLTENERRDWTLFFDGQIGSAIVMLSLRHLTVYVKQPMNSVP